MSVNKPFRMGPFALLTIVGAMTVFLWIRTFEDPAVIYGLTTALFFIVAGMAFSMTMVGVQLDFFRFRQFMLTIFLTGINVVAIWYVNQRVPLGINREQAVLVGVGEEVFFTLFLCGLIYRMTHNEVISIISSSLIWSVFHIFVYGGDFNILLVVFLCGCVLRTTFLLSRSPDSCIFAHGVVNWIAL